MDEKVWIDENGYKHISIMPSRFGLLNPEEGLLNDPPNLDEIDWELVKRNLHNLLIDRRILAFRDLQSSNGHLNNAILLCIRPQIIELFRKQLEVNNA